MTKLSIPERTQAKTQWPELVLVIMILLPNQYTCIWNEFCLFGIGI